METEQLKKFLKKMKITQIEIGKESRCSTQTVLRLLNEYDDMIKHDTKRKFIKAVRHLVEKKQEMYATALGEFDEIVGCYFFKD